MKTRIYLDYAATTPVDETVLKTMLPYFDKKFGNASSVHSFGREARDAVEKARAIIAKSINAEPNEIIFTSGSTESDNLALKGVAWASKKSLFGKKKVHIITTKIEHDGILNACKWLEKNYDCKITYLNVDNSGFVDLKQLESSICKETVLVSVAHGNNEIGTIQNIAAIGKLCRSKGVYLHTDACQSYTKMPIDVKAMQIDLMTLSAHKIYGPKGIGLLYIRKGVNIETGLHGGGQEFNRRSGTENVPGIVGFGCAASLDAKASNLQQLQKYFYDKITTEIKDVIFNGSPIGEKRLPNNLNISFKYIEGEALLLLLDEAGIAVSTGSACSSHTLDTSHVLKAIGVRDVDANGTIRISIGKHTTKSDIDYAIDVIKKSVTRLRSISPFGKK